MREVEYPKLKRESGLPGYDELGDDKKWPYKKRVECLTTPWSPWYPYQTGEENKQESKPEIKDTFIPGNSIVYKEDQSKPTSKSKTPSTNKCRGIVKWFDEKKGYGFITKDNGEDVFVHISAIINKGVIPKEGQRVDFDTVQGEKGLQALSVFLKVE